MKKLINSIIVAMLVLASGCSSSKKVTNEGIYTAGVYSASAKGFGGNVTVTITVDSNSITAVEIDGADETENVGQASFDEFKEQIISAQSAEIDGVSGATFTSDAVKEATASALATAKGEEIGTDDSVSFTAGTYSTTVKGMGGDMEVSVSVSNDKITDITVGENKETQMVGTEALRILSERIVETQSLGVDAVTGATVTSNAFISAVSDCVSQAGGNVAAMKAREVGKLYDYSDKTHEADIIIVGGGLAGISAAISATENGGNVILLEYKEYLGGNSVLSTGNYLLGGGNSIQTANGITDDTVDSFIKWQMEDSDNKKTIEQCTMVAENSQTVIDWLTNMGVVFDDEMSNTDGSDIQRTLTVSPNIATGVSPMIDYMNKLGVDVRYGTKVTGFVVEDGELKGVKATDYNGDEVEYYGKDIILASGGWGDNNDMIVKYWGKEYDGLVYGGSKGMDGTMLLAAMDTFDADTVDMDDKHIDATLDVTRGITVTTNIVRNAGGILIRQSTGKRFVDEQASHSEKAATAMHEIGDEYYYEIFDNNALNYNDSVTYKVNSYINMGLTTQYDSIEDMADGIGVDPEVLTETIENYNTIVRGEATDEFGREKFFHELKAPFYVLKVANGVACTTGGLKVNAAMQVVNTDDEVCADNLYAIGEIAGGYLVSYVGGSSLSHSTINGMVLGKELATK